MELLQAFIEKAIKNEAIQELDTLYLANEIRALEGVDDLSCEIKNNSTLEIVDTLTDIAEENGRIEMLSWSREMFENKLYSFLTPLPSLVNKRFQENYAHSPKRATDVFYRLSEENNYIKTREIAKNIEFEHKSQYGVLNITINLSKPEKDPKEIAKAKLQATSHFPKCQLCMENEGYLGRSNHPARSNHRIIRLGLGNEKWGFQYSPYAYYKEHCIFLNELHQPMVINGEVFGKILALVEQFPHYFVGSNADLPIVGGSILTHEHFQGGIATLPMANAKMRRNFGLPQFPQIKAGILEWAMTVIRLSGKDLEELTKAATLILEKWQGYSDKSVEIIAQTNGVPHHTITPIARKRDEDFELDLVLRDNHTTAEFPDGVFHPHKDVQHIKKENIGLIEVMGLAILPPRLKTELVEVENYLLGKEHKIEEMHKPWAEEILSRREITEENAGKIVLEELGEKFVRVLQDASVFKEDEKGKNALNRFLDCLQK
ncbi:UDPglucose--hexose-1-phosphate uridylyltransferase [Pilibacter termitis]|uniref:Galactose-1-phosphate uridylyltransferase n=1 Tax=Pilibacter termitis TaxID=263852 RepID=A0A1T4PM31_9ENTE|nr:UDP-glucose--hexose-1-phosphate uridylyltransferase [Pilibacter termitis]SJZ92552.1 UDPglucose--hexose-1-phosphate uridylyltransferase [Pilibacter termitis]